MSFNSSIIFNKLYCHINKYTKYHNITIDKFPIRQLFLLTRSGAMSRSDFAVRDRRRLSGRYTVRCNLAEFVIRGSSYKDSEPRALHAWTHATCHSCWCQWIGPYTLYDIGGFTPDKSRNNFLHAQTMASAIVFESRTIIIGYSPA